MSNWWSKFWLILLCSAACAAIVAEASQPVIIPDLQRLSDGQYRAVTAQQFGRDWLLIATWGAGVIACVGALAYLWKRNEDQI